MRRTRSETKAIIVPIAGVCNIGLTASELFQPLRQSLENTLDVTVLNPFVPPKLGVRQPISQTVKDFHEYMARVGYVFPHVPRILLGHSLGGMLAHEVVTTSDTDQNLGSITIATPLGGLQENHWLVHKDRVREINALAADIAGNGDHLAQLAAQYDTVVPWESALTYIEGSGRFLQKEHCSTESRMARIALAYSGMGRGVVEHNALLRQPATVRLATFLAGTMLEKAGIEQPPSFQAQMFDLRPFEVAA
jgi:hypothetical protein